MNSRVLVQLLALVGGLAWLVRWLAGNPSWGDTAYVIGLVGILTAVSAAESGVVSKGAVWLRVVVGVATFLLIFSVLMLVGGDGWAVTLLGLIGLLAVIGVAVTAVRARGRRTPVGSHVAPR